ncbi:dephospho-CoA kinase [Paenibacillus senegalensis]|uniref:dephospho-CoA kinase n=1 Tax=Paenibacillus senegalensis TaxID=1465766 RepID=UPI00028900CB|nr:dephospho-CoA kinase [Paenibacillus senegalensis]
MNTGLTGGIASGKSTVSKLLADRGAIIVDADQIAREVVLPGTPLLSEVAQTFGEEILLADGSLNRKKLGSIVFSDEAKRKKLESMLHPAIRKLMRERMEDAEAAQPDKLVVVDIPLLYESDLAHLFEEVIVVYVPVEIQIERLMSRDGLSQEQALQRIETQMPIELKKQKADVVIDNSGSLEQTARQIEEYMQGKGLR